MTLIPVMLVLPLLAAALLACFNRLLPAALVSLLAVTAAVVTTGLAVVLMLRTAASGELVYWFGGWRPDGGVALGIGFVAAPASCALVVLGGTLAAASLVYAAFYFEEVSRLFATLVLVFLAAIVGYCLSGDLFTLFVFFELMATTAYALTAYKIEAPSLAGGIAFAVISSLGAYLLLWGIALLYSRLGALNLAQLGVALRASDGVPPAYLGVALALVTAGFLVKAAAVPFHFWHADADAVAPTPVCILISGIMAELGLYGLARVYFTVFAPRLGGAGAVLWHVLLYVGVLTVLVGGVMCFRQQHAKRLLAFSTISHVGIMLCGLALAASGAASGAALGTGNGGTGNPAAIAAAAGAGLYLLAHGPLKAGLFLGTGIVLNQLGSVDEDALHGRGGFMRLTGVLFVVGALGLFGLPPFGTFIGRAMIDQAARAAGEPWLHWVLTAGETLTAAAVLRFAAHVFLGWGPRSAGSDRSGETEQRDGDGSTPELPRVMLGVAWALMLLPVLIAWYPRLPAMAMAAARQLMDSGGYADLVLRGKGMRGLVAAPGAIMPTPDWSLVEGPLGALGLLAVALHGRRLRDRLGAAAAGFARGWAAGPGRLLAALDTVHRGFIGDYVTWLVAGVALLTVLFTWLA